MKTPFLSLDYPAVVLASRSPRRAAILRELGVRFEVDAAPDAVERAVFADDPHDLPVLAASAKGDNVAARHAGRIVLAADTIVVADGRLLNKPRDDEEARAFLRALSGRTHTVVTGVAVVAPERGDPSTGDDSPGERIGGRAGRPPGRDAGSPNGRPAGSLCTGAARTRVTFRALGESEIRRYVDTGEGRDKAGSYAAQGIGAGLIEKIDGCYFNVVGLPVSLTLSLLREAAS